MRFGQLISAAGGSCVYVISASNGLCKVGISSDPELRLATLQTGSAYPLKIEYVLATDTDTRMIEGEVHRRLDKFRCAGEWFDVPANVAIASLINVAEDFSIKLHQTTSDNLLMAPAATRSADQISKIILLCGALLFTAAISAYAVHIYHQIPHF